MPTQSFSARLLDAGAALRTARPAGWGAAGRSEPGPPRRLMIVSAIVVLGVLAVIYLTLRLTPLSAVQRVTVVGVQGPDAPQIRRQIEQAAMGQSTLGFGDGAVHRAVKDSTSITGLTIHAKFPHAVQVEVHQRLAVGAIDSGGKRVAVATDGTLLPDWDVGKLPLIRGARTERGAVVGDARQAAAILATAPPELLAHVARVDSGTTIRLADGPALLFRDAGRLAAKWQAAVAVLNDAGTPGATWIDLRIPEQPVAGKGAPPSLPSRNAKAGRVGSTSDALATAEGRAGGDPDDTAEAVGASGSTGATGATSTAATAAQTPAATPAAPAAGTTSTTPSTTAAAAPSSGGTGTASGTAGASTSGSTASPGTGSGTNSGAVTPATSGAAQTTGTPSSGGGTAPTAQTTP